MEQLWRIGKSFKPIAKLIVNIKLVYFEDILGGLDGRLEKLIQKCLPVMVEADIEDLS